jgi:hypothetical protein
MNQDISLSKDNEIYEEKNDENDENNQEDKENKESEYEENNEDNEKKEDDVKEDKENIKDKKYNVYHAYKFDAFKLQYNNFTGEYYDIKVYCIVCNQLIYSTGKEYINKCIDFQNYKMCENIICCLKSTDYITSEGECDDMDTSYAGKDTVYNENIKDNRIISPSRG